MKSSIPYVRVLPVKVTFNNVERIEDLAGRLAQQVRQIV